jgi:hypothetical protein
MLLTLGLLMKSVLVCLRGNKGSSGAGPALKSQFPNGDIHISDEFSTLRYSTVNFHHQL